MTHRELGAVAMICLLAGYTVKRCTGMVPEPPKPPDFCKEGVLDYHSGDTFTKCPHKDNYLKWAGANAMCLCKKEEPK